MKIVAQIVKDAKLYIDDSLYSEIPYGLLLLVSFKVGDTKEDALLMADKVLKMRIFPDESQKTNLNISDINGEILSVSQFTIYGEFKGRRPSFTNVLPGAQSKELYDIFNKALNEVITVKTGVFGAMMNISFTNVGPVTYILEENA
ncbi:MAG: D-aminoacyl-tRNA deacylase [Bacilli bacterium]|nr:D-aminoacyl-tRNA deacylase [Bacilli bacterium]